MVVREDVAIGIEDHARPDAALAGTLVHRRDGDHRGQRLGRYRLGKRRILGIDLNRLVRAAIRKCGRIHVGAADAKRTGHNQRDHKHRANHQAGERRDEDRELLGFRLHHGMGDRLGRRGGRLRRTGVAARARRACAGCHLRGSVLLRWLRLARGARGVCPRGTGWGRMGARLCGASLRRTRLHTARLRRGRLRRRRARRSRSLRRLRRGLDLYAR